MKLYLCEKPSQAADLAAIFGSARKANGYIDTAEGRLTWCFGHMFADAMPDEYGADFGKPWRMDVLPCVPQTWRRSIGDGKAQQVGVIGQCLAACSEVILATDPDRQGEAIGRTVLEHFNYRGPVKRLWLQALDKASVLAAIKRPLDGADTLKYHHAATALRRADWLVGMNVTRALTLKSGGRGVVNAGRVKTPTLALVVRRDREIAGFKSRDYWEIVAQIVAANGAEISLRHNPGEENRIFDRATAEGVAARMKGAAVVLRRTDEEKRTPPPKLFKLVALQRLANTLWEWSLDHTLEVAQALYEKHKVATYPRTTNEYLPDEHVDYVPAITGHLLQLRAFAHIDPAILKPRIGAVFNSKKVEGGAHHAIVPTRDAADLGRLNDDERRLYLLIAARYLSSLMPDYEYLSVKVWTEFERREFAVGGTTPIKPGWKDSGKEAADPGEAEEGPGNASGGAARIPVNIADGDSGRVESAALDAKKTKAPPRYTEAMLAGDMENIAKYVTDPAQKKLLRSEDGKVGSSDLGIGTSSTRGKIIAELKQGKFLVMSGKALKASDEGHAAVTMIEKMLPALADPGETAVWEEMIHAVAEGENTVDGFVDAMASRVRGYIASLSTLPETARPGAAPGAATGKTVKGVAITDHGEYYAAPGLFTGRLYALFCGHRITADEAERLLKGEQIEVADCATQLGKPLGPKKLFWNAAKKPYPGVEFVDTNPPPQATGVETAKSRGKGGAIADRGTYYTVEGYEAGGYPVRFWKKVSGREITAEELAAILASKADGYELNGFVTADGARTYHRKLYYNGRAKPYPKLEFVA